MKMSTPPNHRAVAQAMDQAQRLRAAGRAADALRALQPILAGGAAPAAPSAFAGRLFLEQGRHDRAIELLSRAAQLVPNDRGYWYSLMLAYKRAGQTDHVIEACRKMIGKDPGYLEATTMIADAFNDLGQTEQAQTALDAIEQHAPADGWTPEQRLRLACVRSLSGGRDPGLIASDAVEASEQFLADPRYAKNPAARTASAQAITLSARALDRVASGLEERQRVLDLLSQAKQIRGAEFDADGHDRRVEAAIAGWSGFDGSSKVSTADGSPLVLIVGMPRSGTSILEQMLACHPSVTPRGERSDLTDVCRRLTDHRGTKLPPLVTDPAGLSSQGIEVLGPQLRQRLVGDAEGLVTTKLPFDFLHVPLAARLVPGCRVVHIRRDPVDTCWSGYLQWFNRVHPHTGSFEWSGRYYRAYDRLMKGYAELPEPVRPAMFELEYESLVRDPEAHMRELLDWLGLAWDPAVLHPERSGRLVMTASREQVRSPINPSSIGRAEAYGALLGPLRDAISGV